MSAVCASCGASLVSSSRFCHECGVTQPASVSPRFSSPAGYTPAHLSDRILRHRSAIEGEHKVVTVLFCDLVNSTGLAERLGPERTHDLLEAFFEGALEIIHFYEGTVNQFLGDGFMALFGAPLSIERHERHAVMAAVALRDRLGQRLRGLAGGHDAQIRIGLHTGPVVVGKIGDNLRMDYTAIGDTTNVAARLQRLAEPNTIIVSATTYERTRLGFRAERLPEVTLPGRSEPIDTYRILEQPRPSPSLPLPAERPLSPFVGRDRELAALHGALTEVEHERGQLVGIIGDAGLGKSRLLSEFRHSVGARRLTWLEGRCVSYGTAIPYFPILELLRANCRIVDVDTPDEIAAKVAAAVSELDLDVTASVPYLLHLLGIKHGGGIPASLGPETIKARTFKTLRELAVRGSRRRPIVFVIEDLHWIDHTSLEFLVELADVAAGSAILLLASYRPGYMWPWGAKSYATQIALRPLTEPDSRAIIDAALGVDVDAGVRGTIAARAEGNPFFLEELARSVREQHGSPTAERIPETLHGLLMSRIDRLPEDAKRTLQVAAVIGREFSTRLLAEVVPETEHLDDHLRQLTHHEFLRVRTTDDEPIYMFSHALTRDVVYESLLERHRRQQHTRVGRALERLHAARVEEAVELLAHHFGRGTDDDRAVEYAIGAAARAQRRWANAEALAFADLAQQRLATMPDTRLNRQRRIDVVIQQAEVRFALGQHEQHVAALRAIQPLMESDAADPRRQAAWHYWTGFLHSLTGGLPEAAIAHCREASAIAEREGLDEIGAFADTCLAQAYHVAGALGAGRAAGERALGTFERHGNVWWACRALAQLSAIANSRGDWDASLGHCQLMLGHGQTLDDLRLKVSALVRLASTHIQRGDPAAGLPLCDEALAAKPTPYDAAAARAIRGYGLIKSGRAGEGVRELADAVAWYERSNLRYTRAQFSLWLAEGCLAIGERERARAVAESVLGVALDRGYRGLEGIAERLLGECLAPIDPEGAAGHLDVAERILTAVGASAEVARTRAERARLAVAGP